MIVETYLVWQYGEPPFRDFETMTTHKLIYFEHDYCLEALLYHIVASPLTIGTTPRRVQPPDRDRLPDAVPE